jgi:hypothetical protein
MRRRRFSFAVLVVAFGLAASLRPLARANQPELIMTVVNDTSKEVAVHVQREYGMTFVSGNREGTWRVPAGRSLDGKFRGNADSSDLGQRRMYVRVPDINPVRQFLIVCSAGTTTSSMPAYYCGLTQGGSDAVVRVDQERTSAGGTNILLLTFHVLRTGL